MGYLFLANLGPTQSFIASARRTRDLWFGSTLLSELAKTIARTIIENSPSNTLIFPSSDNIEEDLAHNVNFTVTNKIIAYIEEEPSIMGEKIGDHMQKRLDALRTYVYDTIVDAATSNNRTRQISNIINKNVADQQINELIELVWVAASFSKDVDSYASTYKELEELLAARKNTRIFKQADPAKSSLHSDSKNNPPKSSIDGQLESVIPLHYYTRPRENTLIQQQNARELYRLFHAGPAEHLSGVDLLKRRGVFGQNGKVRDAFLSTSHIAASSYLERLESLDKDKRKEAQESWNSYISTIENTINDTNTPRNRTEALASVLEKIPQDYRPGKNHSILGRYDGALLFEERLREDFPDPASFQLVANALHSFLKNIHTAIEHSIMPHPYYAILRADGDGMGEIIQHQIQTGEGWAAHQKFSQKLTSFASGVKNIVESDHYKGTLLYAGGDDVLAFLPLHTVLPCAQELSKSFKNALTFDGQEKKPSLSVGIAIVHHLSLLRQALRQSENVERRAKDVTGKDGLAITLYRRSGEEYQVRGKLEELDAYLTWLSPYFIPIADRKDQTLQDISLPKGTAYELRATALRLNPYGKNITPNQREALHNALLADMLRILERKLKMTNHDSDVLLPLLCTFKKRLGIALSQKESKLTADKLPSCFAAISAVDVPEFINEFIIAHELADAQALIGYQSTEQKGSPQ